MLLHRKPKFSACHFQYKGRERDMARTTGASSEATEEHENGTNSQHATTGISKGA
jgi:hypothetical protein